MEPEAPVYLNNLIDISTHDAEQSPKRPREKCPNLTLGPENLKAVKVGLID